MKYLFLEYPKCSTCQKARQWLLDNGVEFEARHIVDNRPSETELKSGLSKAAANRAAFSTPAVSDTRRSTLRKSFPA